MEGTADLPPERDASQLVPDGDSTCVIGLVGTEAERTAAGGLGGPMAGPGGDPWFSKPVGLEPGASPGAWHVLGEEQRVDVYVPGNVVTDLLGERTEQVSIPGRPYDATVWFAREWVQVRYFSGLQRPEPCSNDEQSFTVTVSGRDEQNNRDQAIRVATALVIAGR